MGAVASERQNCWPNWAFLAVVIAGCGSRGDEPALSGQHLAITHGVRSAEERGLVAFAGASGLWCSGTVIADRVVLTAAHCLVGPRSLELLDGSAQLSGGYAATGQPWSAPVAALIPHPEFDGASFAHDIGLVVLADEVPAHIARVELHAGPLDATLLGRQLLVAGFGATLGDAGAEGPMETTSLVQSLEPGRILVRPDPGQPCRGDSGGPALLDDSLVGVTSIGDGECVDHAYLTRVDAYFANFLAPVLATLGPGARGAGEPCFYAEHCASGSCYLPPDVSHSRYCSPPCEQAQGCPGAMTCDETDSGRACHHPVPSPGANGARCTDDAACESNLCAPGPTAPDGPPVCLRPCVSGVVDCPGDAACVPVQGRTGLSACTTSAKASADAGCTLRAHRRGNVWLPLVTLAAFLRVRRRKGRAQRLA